MDLTILIILLMAGLLIYYFIDTIKSLQLEIREIKEKCISTNNSKPDDFTIKSKDLFSDVNKNTINILNNLKTIFDKT